MSNDSNIHPSLSEAKVKAMLEACTAGHLHTIQQLLGEHAVYASQQETATGTSPLMAAAKVGNLALCQHLLEAGAPWNAVDRQGQCAGNYATQYEHWQVVNLLVEWGTRAELVLGALERSKQEQLSTITSTRHTDGPVEHQPSTKPDYLRQRLQYTADGQALLDEDKDAVMMEWERPLMKAHAQVLMEGGGSSKCVMNVGFGMGIIDTALQELQPALHVIIEAHPDVHARMIKDGWDRKPNVRICFGRWQDWLPKLIQEGVQLDGIFYDTYGEHYLDLEDFHQQMVQVLSKPHGRYSFFNGLAPDNLFFHGVACQCVKLQLGHLGLDTDFLSCEIQVKDAVWEGIRRKYWHGRDTYYLPVSTWNAQFLAGVAPDASKVANHPRDDGSAAMTDTMEMEEDDGKRQRVV